MLVKGMTIGTGAALLAAAGPALFDPVTGYRVAEYRAVVRAAPPGVPTITAARVARLADRGEAILIDVMPAEGGVRDAATGRWRLARPHSSIPQAHWFPEAGRGRLDPDVERWFLSGVRQVAASRPGAPVIVFCLADCWMSWNAALRLRRTGVRHVRWFPEGADGWRDLRRPLVNATPFVEVAS